MSGHAVEIENLSKKYAARGKSPEKIALEDISLTIPRGAIFGLLGPNGAGKSTLINIMASMVLKSAGRVRIWDADLDADPRQVKSNIGIVPQEINYDPFFTPAQILDLQAGMFGVPKKERRTMELLEMMGLADKANAYTRSLSGGMRRRLMIAKAMVHSPPILVLDEPTAGVDLELRTQLWDNVRLLNRQGLTVLLTTHYLEEAEELCSRIAIINKGRIVADEDKETLLARIDSKELRFRLTEEIGTLPESLMLYAPVQEGKRSLMFRFSPKEQSAGEIIAAIQAAGYGIADVSTDERKLEDVFLQMTRSA
jgi:ABC-2 type transport system ATP-binding protein